MPERSNAQKVDLFERAFVGRKDAHGRFDWDSEQSRTIKAPLTRAVIFGHLKGHYLLGIFPLDGDTTQFIVADFDDHDGLPPTEFVKRAAHYGIHCYIERSKSTGYHVIAFAKEPGANAAKARAVFRMILKDIEHEHTEVFPKQDRVDANNPYGNFIHVPFCGRLVPEGRTVFVDPNDDLKPYPNQWDVLEGLKRITEEDLDTIIEINELTVQNTATTDPPNHHTTEVSPFTLPPCMRRMLAEGVQQNQRVACFRLAVQLRRVGLPFDLAVASLREWATKNRPIDGKGIIREEEIVRQAGYAYTKGYTSCGCENEAIKPFCDPACPVRHGSRNNNTPHERKETS